MSVLFAFGNYARSNHHTWLGANLPTGFTESSIAQELNPTTMASVPDGRLFLAMKDGRVLVMRDNVLQEDPLSGLSTTETL